MGEQACEAALFISIENSHSVTDAFIFSGNSAEIKVGKNLGLMYHRAGDAGHVKISLPIHGGEGGLVFVYLRCIVRNTYERADVVGGPAAESEKLSGSSHVRCPPMHHRLIMAEDFQGISNKFYTGLASIGEI